MPPRVLASGPKPCGGNEAFSRNSLSGYMYCLFGLRLIVLSVERFYIYFLNIFYIYFIFDFIVRPGSDISSTKKSK